MAQFPVYEVLGRLEQVEGQSGSHLLRVRAWGTEYVLKQCSPDGNEAKICRRIQEKQHENIIRIFAVSENTSADKPYHEVLMSYVRCGFGGNSLQRFVQNQPRNQLPYQQLLELAAMVAAGMDFLIHEVGVLHCDLDQRNIMVTESKIPVIIDLGHAVDVDTPTPKTKELPILRAPETYDSSQFSEKSDVFKYGCVLYFMCTGVPLFHGKSHDEVSAAVLRGDIVSIPDTHVLSNLVTSCLHFDPVRRPSFKEIVGSLDKMKRLGFHFQLPAIICKPGYSTSGYATSTHKYTPATFINSLVRVNALKCNDGIAEGYLPGNIVCMQMPDFDKLDTECPPEYKQLYAEKYAETLALLHRGKIFDRPMLALKEFEDRNISRNYIKADDVEHIKVTLGFRVVNYLHHYTMQSVFTTIAPTREKIIELANSRGNVATTEVDYTTVILPEFSTSFGINIGVFTTDRKAVITRRSAASKNTGKVNFSVSEGMNPSDVDKFGQLNVWMAAKRALNEEFGINLSDDELPAIAMSYVVVSIARHEYNIFGWLDLSNTLLRLGLQLSLEGLKARPKPDGYEFSEIIGVDMDTPQEMFKFLSQM